MKKRLIIIAGPNGAGKTTHALSIHSNSAHIHEFINADEIAKGLAPLNPESVALTASKLLVKRLKELLVAGKSFAIETTAAGKNYIKHIEIAKRSGYDINLIYLWLESAELAIQRVNHRVAQGGHHIPEDVVRRRYKSGLTHILNYYLPLADTAFIFDNSKLEDSTIVAFKKGNEPLIVKNKSIWEAIERSANA